MPKRYVLRCERNWVLESESDKEEDWLVVAALGDVLEKVLIDFCKLFQRIGAVRLYERLDILREEVVDGRSRVRWLEERVKPAGLILISFLWYWDCEVFWGIGVVNVLYTCAMLCYKMRFPFSPSQTMRYGDAELKYGLRWRFWRRRRIYDGLDIRVWFAIRRLALDQTSERWLHRKCTPVPIANFEMYIQRSLLFQCTLCISTARRLDATLSLDRINSYVYSNIVIIW